MGHADGLCSIFLHRDADVDKAVRVVVDAKTTYEAACNSTETLLVHRDVLATVLPRVAEALVSAGVTLHCDEECLKHVPTGERCVAAAAGDFDTEWLSLDLSVKARGAGGGSHSGPLVGPHPPPRPTLCGAARASPFRIHTLTHRLAELVAPSACCTHPTHPPTTPLPTLALTPALTPPARRRRCRLWTRWRALWPTSTRTAASTRT